MSETRQPDQSAGSYLGVGLAVSAITGAAIVTAAAVPFAALARVRARLPWGRRLNGGRLLMPPDPFKGPWRSARPGWRG